MRHLIKNNLFEYRGLDDGWLLVNLNLCLWYKAWIPLKTFILLARRLVLVLLVELFRNISAYIFDRKTQKNTFARSFIILVEPHKGNYYGSLMGRTLIRTQNTAYKTHYNTVLSAIMCLYTCTKFVYTTCPIFRFIFIFSSNNTWNVYLHTIDERNCY